MNTKRTREVGAAIATYLEPGGPGLPDGLTAADAAFVIKRLSRDASWLRRIYRDARIYGLNSMQKTHQRDAEVRVDDRAKRLGCAYELRPTRPIPAVRLICPNGRIIEL